MIRHLEICQVYGGSEIIDSCPDDQRDRSVTPLLALTDIGPYEIGHFIDCDGCGARFQCAFCCTPVPFDGAATHQHLRTHSDG